MADPRKLKERATEAFSKGKFAKAAEAYAEYCAADPKDLQARLRMGDAWAKGGKKDKAIAAYTWAAEGFAKDGFLPRAIAASKLILELDPSHNGVQKMLADLYARKTGPTPGGSSPGSKGSPALRVDTRVATQTTAAGFAHRKDAIELDAKPAPLAKTPVAPNREAEPPSPMNRKDAIELPAYEVPGAETATAGSSSVPIATRGPRPTMREDAIEIEDEDVGRRGPAALNETSIELDVGGAAQPQPPRPSGPSIEVELGPAQIQGHEIEVPIEGVEVPLPGPSQRPVASPGEQSARFELKVEEPAVPPERSRGTPFDSAQGVRPGEQSATFDLTVEAPAPSVPSPGEQSATFDLTVEAAPAPKPPPVPAAKVWDLSDDEPLAAAAAAPSAPPGLKPRRSAPDAPPPALPLAAAEPPPSAPRIWLPGNFSSPSGAAAAPPGLPGPAAAPEQLSAPVAARESSSLTDLERGMEIFSRFDAEDFFVAARATAPVEPPLPPPPPAAPQAPPVAAKAQTRRTFTELELEGDSLLHAVEAAAELGIEQRGQQGGAAAEEMMELPDDAKPLPGELPKIPLFSDLPPDAFIALFERCPLKRVEPGEIVIQQGTLGDSFYVICAGSVRVFRNDGERRREIATLEEGAFFGEMALLSGAARAASVEAATEDTQLLEISAPLLSELSHRYPQVATALKKFCRQRLLSNLMNTSALFQPFSRNDRRDLVQRFRARDVAKGDVLIKEGHRSDGMYVILSGEVEVRVGPTPVASLKEGDVFGEMSLLTKAPATASVAASKRTSLLRLPREDFDKIIMSHPQVLVLVSELTDSRTRHNATIASRRAPSGDAAPMV